LRLGFALAVSSGFVGTPASQRLSSKTGRNSMLLLIASRCNTIRKYTRTFLLARFSRSICFKLWRDIKKFLGLMLSAFDLVNALAPLEQQISARAL
jgi:hypothetical protein